MLRADVVNFLMTKIAREGERPTVIGSDGRRRPMTPQETEGYLRSATPTMRRQYDDPDWAEQKMRSDRSRYESQGREFRETALPNSGRSVDEGRTVLPGDEPGAFRPGDQSLGRAAATTGVNALAKGVSLGHWNPVDSSMGATVRDPDTGGYGPDRRLAAIGDNASTTGSLAVPVPFAGALLRGGSRAAVKAFPTLGRELGAGARGAAEVASTGPRNASIVPPEKNPFAPGGAHPPTSAPPGATELSRGPKILSGGKNTPANSGAAAPISARDALVARRAAVAADDARFAADLEGTGIKYKGGPGSRKTFGALSADRQKVITELHGRYPNAASLEGRFAPGTSGRRMATAAGGAAVLGGGYVAAQQDWWDRLSKAFNGPGGSQDTRSGGAGGGPPGKPAPVRPGAPAGAATPGAAAAPTPESVGKARVAWGGKGGVGTYSGLASQVYGDEWGKMKGNARSKAVEDLRTQWSGLNKGNRTLLAGQSMKWGADHKLQIGDQDTDTARLKAEGREAWAKFKSPKNPAMQAAAPAEVRAPVRQERVPVQARSPAPNGPGGPTSFEQRHTENLNQVRSGRAPTAQDNLSLPRSTAQPKTSWKPGP